MLTASGITMEKKARERIILHIVAWKLSCPISQAKGIITVSASSWQAALEAKGLVGCISGRGWICGLRQPLLSSRVCCSSSYNLSYYRTRSDKRVSFSLCSAEPCCVSSFACFHPHNVSKQQVPQRFFFASKLSKSYKSFDFFPPQKPDTLQNLRDVVNLMIHCL